MYNVYNIIYNYIIYIQYNVEKLFFYTQNIN